MGHLHAFWDDLWPNVVAPSLWTILAVGAAHVRSYRQRERQHREMKQHVTDTQAGKPGSEEW